MNAFQVSKLANEIIESRLSLERKKHALEMQHLWREIASLKGRLEAISNRTSGVSFDPNYSNYSSQDYNELEPHVTIATNGVSYNPNGIATTSADYSTTDITTLSGKKKRAKKGEGRVNATFDCPICGRSFDRMAKVRRHQTVHTHERNYNCSECFKSFTQTHHLKLHMANKHPDSPLPMCLQKKRKKTNQENDQEGPEEEQADEAGAASSSST